MRPQPTLTALVVVTALALTVASCSWQAYAVSRGLRYATGAETRLHTLQPVASSLREYRVIEIHPLDDLLPGHVPVELERYLNARLARELQSVPTAPRVVLVDPLAAPADGDPPAADPSETLLCQGYIDDYDPGYLSLRLVELGFNHVALTVRLQLRDKSTGHVVGAASVTAQDDRVSATSRGAVDRLVHRLGQFVDAGYGG